MPCLIILDNKQVELATVDTVTGGTSRLPTYPCWALRYLTPLEFLERWKSQQKKAEGHRSPRFSDMPQIEAVMLDRKDIEPAGAGETPMFGLAPAIGNAIFDATGIRLRALPLVPNGLDLRKA